MSTIAGLQRVRRQLNGDLLLVFYRIKDNYMIPIILDTDSIVTTIVHIAQQLTKDELETLQKTLDILMKSPSTE